MKGIGTWSYRRLFWAGVVVIVLLVGGRITWVEYTRKSAYFFAKRKTDFQLLGKPYQPKWEPEYWTDSLRERFASQSLTISIPEDAGRMRPVYHAVLLEDRIQGTFSRNVVSIRVSAYCDKVARPSTYDTRIDCEDFSLGNCHVDVRVESDEDDGVFSVTVVETFQGVSRKATFRFRLTQDGFLAVEDQ